MLGAALGAQTTNTSGPDLTVPVRNDATNVNVAAFNHEHTVSTVQPTFILNYIIKT